MFFQKKKIEEILKNKTGQDAIIKIDNILSPIFYKNSSKLTNNEKTIVFIEELEREINNGGFSQFFFNPTGDYSEEVLLALKEIGSTGFLEIVKKAIEVFPNSQIPKNCSERQKLLLKIEEISETKWEILDQEFCRYEEDIYKLMIDYIRKNIDGFR